MLAFVLAALLQGAAAEGATPTIVNPDWQRRPTAEDIARYYPKAALKEDLAGRVVLSCTVEVDGRLSACTASQATPQGAGFEEAAVAMSEVFRMRPQTRDGRPVAGGTVKIPLNFIIPANLRAAGVRAQHPEVKNEIVELDCRYTDLRLDNCFARGGSTLRAREIALKAAEAITLPGLPTRRRQGRIVLPLVFAAPGEPIVPELVTMPRWRERASPHDVFKAYPQAAHKAAHVGNVVMECRVDSRGELADCVVTSESPEGFGFGEAALALAPQFRSDEVDGHGHKVEGRRIRVPFRFSPVPPPTEGGV